MQYVVNKLEKGKVEVKVDVPKVGFSEAYNQVLGELSKDAKVDGFRPGKVPTDVVEQRLGTNKILNEAASFLISKHLSEILKKEDLVLLDSPKIAIDGLAKDSPLSFTATFTQKPQIKIGDWKKLKVKKIKAKEITEHDVTESIKNIYEAWKKQKAKGTEGPKEPEEPKGQKFIYDAQGNKIFLKDEEKESESQSDKESKIDDGPSTHSVNSGQASSGPNDEFAKAIGAQNLSHLKELVKKDLESIVADNVEMKFEQEIFEKIRDLGQVEVPDVLVDDELNRMLVRLSTQLERDGKNLDAWLKEQKTTIDELKTKWREQAEKNVKTSLLLDQIGKDEKVQVSREEVDNAMKGVNQATLSADQKEDLERYIVFSIFQSKTLALVKKTVSS